MGHETSALDRGIGCGTVMPAALIGVAGLADGIGPAGWRGLSELVGWAAICIAVSLLVAMLFSRARARAPGARSYRPALLMIAVAALFTFIPYYVGLAAPIPVKVAFTTTLQVAGNAAVVALTAAGSYALWTHRRD